MGKIKITQCCAHGGKRCLKIPHKEVAEKEDKREEIKKQLDHMIIIARNQGLVTMAEIDESTERILALFEEDRATAPAEPERWKPNKREEYWIIGYDGEPIDFRWDNAISEVDWWNFGNCFKTREQAKQASEDVKKLLHHFHRLYPDDPGPNPLEGFY